MVLKAIMTKENGIGNARKNFFFLFFYKPKKRNRPGHDVNFFSDLPRRASEIQFSLALLQLSLALENLYV